MISVIKACPTQSSLPEYAPSRFRMLSIRNTCVSCLIRQLSRYPPTRSFRNGEPVNGSRKSAGSRHSEETTSSNLRQFGLSSHRRVCRIDHPLAARVPTPTSRRHSPLSPYFDLTSSLGTLSSSSNCASLFARSFQNRPLRDGSRHRALHTG